MSLIKMSRICKSPVRKGGKQFEKLNSFLQIVRFIISLFSFYVSVAYSFITVDIDIFSLYNPDEFPFSAKITSDS